MMRRFLTSAVLALALATGSGQPAPLAAESRTPVQTDLVQLAESIDIPYERFELENGLVTIVHTDRKAPVIGVTVYYRVGSKHEPRGKTGFAHLYEHLFFGGSANLPLFHEPMETAGMTSINGSTWYDRTNYVEVAPKGAVELALFAESDRMGHLLPAVTQDKLDKQRGIVQNEKRQGDNAPYGLAEYATSEGLFPVGHPYRHATIGSMADLDAATLTDVRNWFRDNYGPNNAILVLSGDIDIETARPLAEKWFGHIPRGPEVPQVEAGPVTLDEPVTREMTDQVPVTRISRNWSAPGLNHPDALALEIGMRVLGGLASSRLDNSLVRGSQLAVRVSSASYAFEQVSIIDATMEIKPGIEREAAEREFERVIARFIAEGPTEDEMRRAVVSTLSTHIGSLERVGGFHGKGTTLAEGELYSGDPAKFRKDLIAMAGLTTGDVRTAMQRWLNRPAFTIAVVPGERVEDGATMGGWGDESVKPAPAADTRQPVPEIENKSRRTPPEIVPVEDLDFPELERATLSNGIDVTLMQRTSVPKLIVSLAFDAGIAADSLDTPGTQAFLMDMLNEGTASRDATAIAEDQERLGARIDTWTDRDRSTVRMSALSANLAPSLELMADIVRNPAFAEDDFSRVKQQRLADLSQTLANPRSLASRELTRLIYAGHPYAHPPDGLGDEASLNSVTAADLRAAQGRWLHPGKAHIAVTGDITMTRLLPLLEDAFGSWETAKDAAPEKPLAAAIAPQQPKIVLINRPNSPQSVVIAGYALPVSGSDPGQEALDLANDVIGGGFLARLNEELREQKGWSYGVYSRIGRPAGPRSFAITAPVQSDRTGDTIRTIRTLVAAFPDTAPVTPDELQRVVDGNINSLPNRFETNANVLGAIETNTLLGRPDDYYEELPGRYRALTAADIEQAAREFISADKLVFVVVGDSKIVEPQLQALGLPVEIRESPPPGG